MDLSTFVPLPVHIAPELCTLGGGVAVSHDTLVICGSNVLQVFAVPDDVARSTPRVLVHLRTLGGTAPMEFQFDGSHDDPYFSGYMAFTDDRLLLVADHKAVHVIDVVRGTHVGYVAAPGTIHRPRGVAARKSLAAVSAWKEYDRCDSHSVRIFERGRGECAWTAVRVIAGDFRGPLGLRFTADGLRLAVADCFNSRVRIFCAKDGSFLCDMALWSDMYPFYPLDVEECEDGSGWVVCDGSEVAVVSEEGTVVSTRDVHVDVLALAVVSGMGLVVRHCGGVQFFATPDAVAMASMSLCKVAWMVAVCRG